MKKLICSSLALICILSSMVGCGDKKDNDSAKEETTTVAADTTEAKDADETTGSGKASSIDSKDAIGKWQCSKLVLEGKEMESLYGVEPYALFQIELKDGNKGTFYSFLYSEDGKPQDIEWENKDGKIQLISKEVFDEDDVYLVDDNGKMILNLSEEGDTEKNEATLEKVDSFKEIPEDMEMSIDLDTEGEVETFVDLDEGEAETTENK